MSGIAATTGWQGAMATRRPGSRSSLVQAALLPDVEVDGRPIRPVELGPLVCVRRDTKGEVVSRHRGAKDKVRQDFVRPTSRYVEVGHGHLNVDHVLGRQTGNRCRPDVINS